MKLQLDGEQDDNNANIKEIVHDACGKRSSKFHLVIDMTERHKCVGDGCTDVAPMMIGTALLRLRASPATRPTTIEVVVEEL